MFGDSSIRLASIIIGILFILGLIIVANRFGSQIRQKFSPTRVVSNKITPSPLPIEVTPEKGPENFGQITGETKGETTSLPNVNKIPESGAETIVIPILISTLGLGLKLRSKI